MSDYDTKSGTLTFAAGVGTQSIEVSVNGDATTEPDEQFTVQLANAQGAAIVQPTGTVTIVNDDASTGLQISVGDVKILETQRRQPERPRDGDALGTEPGRRDRPLRNRERHRSRALRLHREVGHDQVRQEQDVEVDRTSRSRATARSSPASDSRSTSRARSER